jgi:hypothetical protein
MASFGVVLRNLSKAFLDSDRSIDGLECYPDQWRGQIREGKGPKLQRKKGQLRNSTASFGVVLRNPEQKKAKSHQTIAWIHMELVENRIFSFLREIASLSAMVTQRN